MAWLGEELGLQGDQLKYLFSDLCRLLEQFWAVQAIRKNEQWRDEVLLEVYFQRRLDKYFSRTLDQSRQILEAGSGRDAAYHYHRYRLEAFSHEFTVNRTNREPESAIQELLNALDTFYFSEKLRYSAAALNRQNVLQVELGTPLLEELLTHLAAHPPTTAPAVEIYRQIIFTLQRPTDDDAFERLLELLAAHQQAFAPQEQAEMYAFALNYCIRQINLGRAAFSERLFGLYHMLAREGLLFDGDYLPPQHFKNLVTLGLRLARYAEVAELIRTLPQQLPPEVRDNSARYSAASLHFARREFGQALRTLQAVEFTDVFYHLDAKCLLLKTYYELDEIEPFFSLVDTFRVYLRRNRKISDYQRRVYRNFVKYIKQLMKYRLDGRKPLSRIATEVESVPEMADKAWLRGKIAALEA